MDSKKPHIVVLGAGFGGVRAALNISKLLPESKITLVNDSPLHCYVPSLYEAATAVLTKERKRDFQELMSTVSIPLAKIFAKTSVQVLVDRVKGIDLEKKEVSLQNDQALSYDYLVIGLGSTTNYFGIPGAEDYSHPLKSTDEALNVRDDLYECHLRAGDIENLDAKLNVVIAGGGFTGVELAGAMGKLLGKIGKITILEGSDHLLNGMPEWAQKKALEKLQSLGIKVQLNCLIKEVKESQLTTDKGEAVDYTYLIWTTGVKGISLDDGIKGVEITKRGQISVSPDLSIPTHPEVFVVGDIMEDMNTKLKHPVPSTAWAAIGEGETVAKNIYLRLKDKPTQPYVMPSPAWVVPVGKTYAISNAFGLKLQGKIAWLVKLFISIRYLVETVSLSEAFSIWCKEIKLDLFEH